MAADRTSSVATAGGAAPRGSSIDGRPLEDRTAATASPEYEAQWDEWLTLFANRNEVAEWYAASLRTRGAEWDTFRFLNGAILRRWSPAGLRYIKERAWKIATGNL